MERIGKVERVLGEGEGGKGLGLVFGLVRVVIITLHVCYPSFAVLGRGWHYSYLTHLGFPSGWFMGDPLKHEADSGGSQRESHMNLVVTYVVSIVGR